MPPIRADMAHAPIPIFLKNTEISNIFWKLDVQISAWKIKNIYKKIHSVKLSSVPLKKTRMSPK